MHQLYLILFCLSDRDGPGKRATVHQGMSSETPVDCCCTSAERRHSCAECMCTCDLMNCILNDDDDDIGRHNSRLFTICSQKLKLSSDMQALVAAMSCKNPA